MTPVLPSPNDETGIDLVNENTASSTDESAVEPGNENVQHTEAEETPVEEVVTEAPEAPASTDSDDRTEPPVPDPEPEEPVVAEPVDTPPEPTSAPTEPTGETENLIIYDMALSQAIFV
jgi:hypothetical protein